MKISSKKPEADNNNEKTIAAAAAAQSRARKQTVATLPWETKKALAELALKSTKSALSLGQKVGGTGSAGGLRGDQDSAT